MAKTIGTRFAEERERLGFTQLELGKKINRTFQSISNWENDHAKPPSHLFEQLDGVGFDIRYVLTGKRSIDKLQENL